MVMIKKRIFAFLMIMVFVLSLSACAPKSPMDDLISDLENMEIPEKPTVIEPEYETVSRPIKDFWIVRGGVLALTESGELYYGLADTANPVFITSNVKEIILSEDGYTGLILLNDGKIIKANNRGNFKGSIYINELMTETPDCSAATYDVSAKKLFNENLYFDAKGILKDLEGNVIFDQPVKDGYVMDYSTNYGARFNGLFLLEDGTVVHRFAKYGDNKDRVITTDAARLNLFVSSNIGTVYYGSVVRNNGDLLTWILDEYAFESDPLSPVSKVASNVNPKFDTISYGSEVYFIDSENTLCCWEEDKAEVVKLKGDVTQVYYNGVDLHTGGLTYADDRIFVIDENYDLYNPGTGKVFFSNVKELIGGGLFANYLDNKCSRFDGDYGEAYRLNNVKQAKVDEVFGSGDVLQVYLKYGGALYAANGEDSTIYKTSFCEVSTSLSLNGTAISLKQAIQSKNGAYMLPYDELCGILKLTPMEDKTTNGLAIESASVKLEFIIDEIAYTLNGSKKNGTVAPYKDSDGLLWIPIEVVTTSFGYEYSVDSSGSSVCININN